MKKQFVKYSLIVSIIILSGVFFSFSNSNTSKPSRVGYLSVNQLVAKIDDYKNNRGKLDTLILEFSASLQEKANEFQQKQRAFVKDSASMNEVIKQDRLKELQRMSQSIQEFQKLSERTVAKQDSMLVQPILNRVQNAINTVAEAQRFSYIINSDVVAQNGPPMLLYSDKDSDISELVLEAYKKNNAVKTK